MKAYIELNGTEGKGGSSGALRFVFDDAEPEMIKVEALAYESDPSPEFWHIPLRDLHYLLHRISAVQSAMPMGAQHVPGEKVKLPGKLPGGEV